MKKIFLIICCLLVVLSAACTQVTAQPSSTLKPQSTLKPTPQASAVPTTAPDYANVDFTGEWSVSMVRDSAGTELSESEIQSLGAGFVLELSDGGVYFIYDANGAVLGQGQYSVIENIMTLSTSTEEMRYVVQDADTFYSTSPDDSVTFMTRCVDDTDEEGVTEEGVSATDTPEETA